MPDQSKLELDQNGIDLFISHAHHDSELVRQLIDVIECALFVPEGAIRCTSLTDYSLDLGALPREILSRELSSTKCVIALMTPHSLLSHWCQFELGAAWVLSKNTIPILAGDIENRRSRRHFVELLAPAWKTARNLFLS